MAALRIAKFPILIGLACIFFCGAKPPELNDQSRLAAILKKSAAYCQRLEKAALDFICLEEVTELSVHFTPETKVYLYDYQFIRKNERTIEKRNLISVDGKKTQKQDSSLMTTTLQYKNVLFGPVGLLGESWQELFDYSLAGEDVVANERAAIIEAKPKAAFTEPHCFGRMWVKEEDGSVLKIVWDQTSLGNFRMVEEWAKAHDAVPRITAYSEYGFEKNGLRFPSRNFSENASINKDGYEIISGRMSAIYKGYKFFTVETEVTY